MADEFQRHLDDKQVEGWEIDEESADRAVLVKRSYGSLGGHFLIALLTIWWTFGIGNTCYAAYKYFVDVDKQVVRREDVEGA